MTLQFGPAIDLGFVDKRRSSGQTDTNPLATPANYASESAMDTRLAAISATAYSASNLSLMTQNDKVFALRINDDLAGL